MINRIENKNEDRDNTCPDLIKDSKTRQSFTLKINCQEL